jgi:uncharacterized protein (TIGR03437 family)
MSNRLLLRCAAALLAASFLSGTALAQQTTVTYSYAGLPLPVFGDAANIITIANIFVPQAIAIGKVTARVQIQYPNSGDLKIYLFSPIGTRSILLEHDCSVANVDTTFDDSAPSAWKDFCPTEAGRGPFRPDQPLANSNGQTSFGTWRLAVENDQSDSRSGWITAFSLTITGVAQLTPVIQPETIVNAASIATSGTVAPGEMASIFGSGLGPIPGVSAGVGALPTSLGGTTVLFNGTPAPIAYASAYRVDVQVPFNVTPGGTVSVQVNANSQNGSANTVPVTDAVPAVYTSGFGGLGGIIAINQNGTTNTALTPAQKGNYITIYASGLGAVSPVIKEGAVPPVSPLSVASGTVTADVGGVPASVLYAGLAPGYPGLYQVNLTVPANAPSGTTLLLLYVNGKPSQAGATIQIR